jgi:hypothetical protein
MSLFSPDPGKADTWLIPGTARRRSAPKNKNPVPVSASFQCGNHHRKVDSHRPVFSERHLIWARGDNGGRANKRRSRLQGWEALRRRSVPALRGNVQISVVTLYTVVISHSVVLPSQLRATRQWSAAHPKERPLSDFSFTSIHNRNPVHLGARREICSRTYF